MENEKVLEVDNHTECIWNHMFHNNFHRRYTECICCKDKFL